MNLTPAFIRRRIAHRSNLVKIVDNIGWLFFDKILRMGVGLLVGVWVTRYLGPEQFGSLSFAIAFVGLFGTIAGLGLQDVVVRDIVRYPASREEILGTAALLQFIGGMLAYALVLGVIFWWRPNDIRAQTLVAIIGCTLLLKASDVALQWFESQVQSKFSVWVQSGCFLMFAAIKVGLILSNAPLVRFAWAFLAEALAVALLLTVTLGLRGPRLRDLRITLTRATRLIKESWLLLLSGISVFIYMKIDQVMLGQLLGDEAVGLYSAAVRISEIWYFIPMMIVASLFPTILDAKRRSEVQYYQRVQQLYDLMVWLSVCVALPMTFLSAPIVKLLFGDAYVASGLVLAIHIWAAVFVFLGVASTKSFLAENRQALIFQRTALGAVVSVVANLLLIPRLGVLGAAIATVSSQATAGWLVDGLQSETRQMFVMKLRAMNPATLLTIFRLCSSWYRK